MRAQMRRNALSQALGSTGLRVVAAVLLGVTCLVSSSYYLGLGGSSTNVAPPYTCDVAEAEYRIAKVYSSSNKLEMTIYVSNEDDEISAGVMAYSRNLHPRLRGHGNLHTFYASLCNISKPGRQHCQGLVVDVGAYIGTHALYLAKLGFEVHAFEPYKPSAALLRCSVAANNFQNLHVIGMALSDKNGTDCVLHPPTVNRPLALVAPEGANCAGHPESIIEVVPLDSYWASDLQRREILFLKIDAEGHEEAVLAGATELLRTSPPRFVLIEYYPTMLLLKAVSLTDYLNRLFSAGYRMYDCQQSVEIERTAEGLDRLAVYKDKSLVTDLLLVRESEYPEGTSLPAWVCGYDL